MCVHGEEYGAAFRDIDYTSIDDCPFGTVVQRPRDKASVRLFPDADSLSFEFTPDYFQRVGQMPGVETLSGFMVFAMAFQLGRPIETDTPKLVTKAANTAWVALMIGDATFRRQRLGSRILGHLEDLAAQCGAQRIEIGVFEFNGRALSFFKKHSYAEFERRQQRVYWDGRMWDDIRVLKTL